MIPAITVDQMREVDRLMVEEVGVSILMMMENASRNIASLTRKVLGGSVKNKKIVVLAGKGNNGGDGLGAARHLMNFGATLIVVLAEDESQLNENAKTQYEILKQSNIIVYQFSQVENLENKLKEEAQIIIDALLGYNLKGNPRGAYASLIESANKSGRPILAVDVPSGLDSDLGKANEPTIKAKYTLTLALPKAGLLKKEAEKCIGELYLADLSVPKTVYDQLGIDVPPLFEKHEIVKIK